MDRKRAAFTGRTLYFYKSTMGGGDMLDQRQAQAGARDVAGFAVVDFTSFAIGSSVTVEVWLAKDGAKVASARTLTTSDGKKHSISADWPMSLPSGPWAPLRR